MSKVIDLSLLIEDNMPAHKLFQRPVITTHLSHESSKAFGLGVASFSIFAMKRGM